MINQTFAQNNMMMYTMGMCEMSMVCSAASIEYGVAWGLR